MASSFVDVGAELLQIADPRAVLHFGRGIQQVRLRTSAIRAVLLDAEGQVERNPDVKEWLERIKDAYYDLIDVLEEWKWVADKKKRPLALGLPLCFSNPFQQYMLHRKTQGVIHKIDVIASERGYPHFHILTQKEELINRTHTTPVAPASLHFSRFPVATIHGRDDERTSLIGKLVDEGSQAADIQYVSIVGPIGIGKTALAQLAYNTFSSGNIFRFTGIGGSRILITTRSEIVALVSGSLVMRLTRLSEQDCWLIIRDHAFGNSVDERDVEMIFNQVGRDIVKKCSGVPLIAVTLGGILRGKTSIHEWRIILESNVWESDSAVFKSAFMLSYSLLPPMLRQCLLFCSIFPKNHYIDVDELIKLWMAQSFFGPMQPYMEGQGWRCFTQLSDHSFFQELRLDDNGNF